MTLIKKEESKEELKKDLYIFFSSFNHYNYPQAYKDLKLISEKYNKKIVSSTFDDICENVYSGIADSSFDNSQIISILDLIFQYSNKNINKIKTLNDLFTHNEDTKNALSGVINKHKIKLNASNF